MSKRAWRWISGRSLGRKLGQSWDTALSAAEGCLFVSPVLAVPSVCTQTRPHVVATLVAGWGRRLTFLGTGGIHLTADI